MRQVPQGLFCSPRRDACFLHCLAALTTDAAVSSSADCALPASPVLNSVVLSPRLAPASPVLNVQRPPSPMVAVIQPASPWTLPLTALAPPAQNNLEYGAGPQPVVPPWQDPYLNDDLLMHPHLSHNNVCDPKKRQSHRHAVSCYLFFAFAICCGAHVD